MKVGDRKIYINENQFKNLLLIKEGLNTNHHIDNHHINNVNSHTTDTNKFKQKLPFKEIDSSYILKNYKKASMILRGMEFISYGTSSFKKDKTPQLNLNDDNYFITINKPGGGLWASPVKSNNSWGKYLEYDDSYCQVQKLASYFKFKISKTANIYIIDTYEDLKAVSTRPNIYGSRYNIDFKALYSKYDCDGIYITEHASTDLYIRYTLYDDKLYGLNAWDVESICIFNPDIIEPIEEDMFDKSKMPKRGVDIDYQDKYLSKDNIRAKEWLQMQSDYERYGNQNIRSDMGELFKGGKHPAILAQGHGNGKDTKLARRFNGTIKSGL